MAATEPLQDHQATAADLGAPLAVIGCGPGPSDLLTVRARRWLRAADRVFHAPDLDPAVLAEVAAGAQLQSLAGEAWIDEARAALQAGLRVACLCGGSGRAVYESGLAATLNHAAVRWLLVPGVEQASQGTDGPLSGRRVLVTRPRPQALMTCRRLQDLGAVAISMPTIALAPPADSGPRRAALARLADYQRLILTSANAVPLLTDALFEVGLDVRALAQLAVCAIGPATAAALRAAGLRADLVAEEYRAEGLLEHLPADRVCGQRILLFRAEEAREELPRVLRERGAQVDVVTAYVTTLPAEPIWRPGLAAVRVGAVDAVIFSSASTARHFVQIVGTDWPALLEGVTVAAIGPITARACEALGLRVAVVPRDSTIDGLLDALVAHYASAAEG